MSAAQTIQFNEDSHEYRVNSVIFPSVTQVINSVLPPNFGPMTDDKREWVLQRGKALHHACRLSDEDRLDTNTVAPEIALRLAAWLQFKVDHDGWNPEAIEVPMAHAGLRYAGTIDRVFMANDGDTAIIDIKSSVCPQGLIQLSAYAMLWHQQGKNKYPRRAALVELKDDGNYRCQWVHKNELKMHEREFLACLTLYNFKKEHGL